MILGTSIGAGILALPIAAAREGFAVSSLLLIICWLAMTFGALLTLEVTLWLPEKTNLVSMAGLTLGRSGQIAAWIFYLLLLFSLLSAYVSGNSDVLQGLLALGHINFPRWVSTILVVLIFGSVIYRGIASVDVVNRILMSSKLIIYLLLVLLVTPRVNLSNLSTSFSVIQIDTILVMITSFGYAIIVPSLRTYFKSNIRQLRLVIFVGSFIPLIFYMIWIGIVHGMLSTSELNGLVNSKNAVSDLANLLSMKLHNSWITSGIRIFISICAATSFLGVGLCLCDFLADGLKLPQRGGGSLIVYGLTFGVPLLIVLLAPGIFITALGYAGIFCIGLLMLLPALMAWYGRYRKEITAPYQVFGGRLFLGIEIGLSLALMLFGLMRAVFTAAF